MPPVDAVEIAGQPIREIATARQAGGTDGAAAETLGDRRAPRYAAKRRFVFTACLTITAGMSDNDESTRCL